MPRTLLKRSLAAGAAVAAGLTAALVGGSASSLAAPSSTTTPIQHLVVIYQENVSFDHYFATYPGANGLSGALLTANPNGTNPRRYDPSNINDVLTCDQDHNYTDEQKAFDGGAMDKFPQTVGTGKGKSPEGNACVAGDVMNYYDGDRDRIVELRVALRDERQLLLDDLRPLLARRDQRHLR